MDLPVRIGRYPVSGLLGRGAMGVVYRARDPALDREVAVKVMALGPDADVASRDRFQREARAAARLQHPNIVTIYELGEHDGSPFMALELLEGLDLQRAIESGLRPNFRATFPVVLQLLTGLAHAHEHGIVHRDVKPSNLFLPRGRPAKIMDFGVARLAGGSTKTGSVIGTPNYMSPEQVRGSRLDGRSDLFSVGLMLYELVTGEKAYRSESVVGLLFKIAHEEPDLSLLPRGAHWEGLRAILVRALAKDPDKRYPHAAAMIADLEEAIVELGGPVNWARVSHEGLVLRGTPRPDPAVSLGTTAPPLAPPLGLGTPPYLAPSIARTTPARTRSRAAVVVASAVGFAALVVGGFVLTRPSREGSGDDTTRPTPSIPPAWETHVPPTPSIAPSAVAPTPRAQATTTPTPERPPTRTEPNAPPSSRPGPAPSILPSVAPSSTPLPVPSGEGVAEPADDPERDDGLLERANELFEKGRYVAALAEAKSVLRREPRNRPARQLVEDAEAAIVVEARIRNAREAMKRDDKEKALEEVRAGLAVAPNDSRLIALFKELTQ